MSKVFMIVCNESQVDDVKNFIEKNICTDAENEYNEISTEKTVSKLETIEHYEWAIKILKKRVQIVKRSDDRITYCIDTDILNKI